MIQNAGRFGFKVYYGDGTRLDVLRAAGAGRARLIAVCVNERGATNRIVDLVRTEFPGTKLYVRSYDTPHTLELIAKGVDYELRETYESALGVRPQHARGARPRCRARAGGRRGRAQPAIARVSRCSRPRAFTAGLDLLHGHAASRCA